MTPLAHAVRFAIRCGIESVDDLARELECTRSAIYRAKKQLDGADRAVTVTDHTVKSDRSELTVRSKTDEIQNGTEVALNIELPKGNTYFSEGVAREGVEEIDGLNGSTFKIVSQLAGWVAGPLGTPDLKTSRDLISGNVDFHGADKVRQGMLDLEALLASGERPRNVCKLFATYVKNATVGGLQPQKQQPKESFVDRKRRETFELLKEMGGLDEQAAH